MPTRLHFDKGHSLTVDDELSAVESEFRTVSANPAALAELTKDGKKMFVNVALVRYFHEYKQGSARVHSF